MNDVTLKRVKAAIEHEDRNGNIGIFLELSFNAFGSGADIYLDAQTNSQIHNLSRSMV